MKKRTSSLCLLAGFLSLVLAAKSHAQTRQDIENEKQILKVSSSYLVDNQKYGEAAQLNRAFLKKFPYEYDIHRQLGGIYVLDQRYAESITEYQESAKFAPDAKEKSISLYLVARSYKFQEKNEKVEEVLAQLNQIPTAVRYVRKARWELKRSNHLPVLSEEDFVKAPGESKSTDGKSVADLEGQEPSLSLGLTYGFDSNPVFVPDGTATVNDAHSTFLSASGGAAVKGYFHGDLENSLGLSVSQFEEKAAQLFNSFSWKLGTKWKPSSHWFEKQKVDFSNQVVQSYQTHGAFNYFFTSDQLSMNKKFVGVGAHALSASLALGGRTYANKDLTEAANNRSGYMFAGRFTHKYDFGNLPLTSSIGINNQKTVGGAFDSYGFDAVANLQRVIFWDIETVLGLSYGQVHYPKNTDKSIDKASGVGVDFSKTFKSVPGLNSKISFSRNRNHSDSAQFTFTQDIISLMVGYEIE